MEMTARVINPAFLGEADPALMACRICGGGATYSWQVRVCDSDGEERWSPTHIYCLRCGTRTKDCETFEQARRIWNYLPKGQRNYDY